MILHHTSALSAFQASDERATPSQPRCFSSDHFPLCYYLLLCVCSPTQIIKLTSPTILNLIFSWPKNITSALARFKFFALSLWGITPCFLHCCICGFVVSCGVLLFPSRQEVLERTTPPIGFLLSPKMERRMQGGRESRVGWEWRKKRRREIPCLHRGTWRWSFSNTCNREKMMSDPKSISFKIDTSRPCPHCS